MWHGGALLSGVAGKSPAMTRDGNFESTQLMRSPLDSGFALARAPE
jgi:hypothetical protein